MTKIPTYILFSDGTHIHENNPFRYCHKKHPKKLSNLIKIAIISGWATSLLLVVHIILQSNNL